MDIVYIIQALTAFKARRRFNRLFKRTCNSVTCAIKGIGHRALRYWHWAVLALDGLLLLLR